MTARICVKANRSSCDRDTHEKCNDRHQDNKFSMTIFARKVDTGEFVWAYQMTPFDQWDCDGVNENVLVDMPIDGKLRKDVGPLRAKRLQPA